MRWDVCLEIPDGYRVIKKERTVDISVAGAWMSTKRQHRYTSALREEDSAVLTRHVVRCPHCGHEVPAYARFLGKGVPMERVPRGIVEQWASAQMTLYDVVDRHLRFNRVVRPGAVYLCPPVRKDLPVRHPAHFAAHLRRGGEDLSVGGSGRPAQPDGAAR